MITSIKLFKESFNNGLTEEQREYLKGRFEKILSIHDFDFELAEIDVDEELSNLPEHQRDEAEEIWTDIVDKYEDEYDEYGNEYESRRSKINKASKMNENIDGLTLDQRFTMSLPLSYTVQSIIQHIVEQLEENGLEIDEQEVLSKLTPELCQEFVDSMSTINDECIDDEKHNAAVYEYMKNFTEELQL